MDHIMEYLLLHILSACVLVDCGLILQGQWEFHPHVYASS